MNIPDELTPRAVGPWQLATIVLSTCSMPIPARALLVHAAPAPPRGSVLRLACGTTIRGERLECAGEPGCSLDGITCLRCRDRLEREQKGS